MKSLIVYIVLFILISFTGCEDLNEEVKTEFATENFYKNEPQLFAASVGMARELTGDIWVEHRFRCTTWSPSKYSHVLTAQGSRPALYLGPVTDEPIELLWSAFYKTIGNANALIKYAPDSPVADSISNQYVAEAKFYRAWCYFNLVRIYGGVPLYTEPVESADNEILYRKRNTIEEVYSLIVEDLQYAQENLPLKSWNYNPGAVRPRAAAAKTLLGQVFLTMAGHPLKLTDKYDEVISTVKPLLDSEEEYGVGLLSDWISVFANDNYNNKELLFISGSDPSTMGSLTPNWTAPPGSGSNYSNNGTYRLMTRNSLQELYTDGFRDDRLRDGFFWAYQLSNGQTRIYWWNHPDNTKTNYFGYYYYDIANDKIAYDPDEDRKYVTGIHASYSGNEGSAAKAFGLATKKFVSPAASTNTSHENQKLWLRLPVAYLSLAEAYCETGDLDNAKKYLNKLRTRAHASEITSTNQDELRQVIRDEWTRELYMEFVSLFNIRRWGVGQDHYENNVWWELTSAPWSEHFYLTPIPASQLSAHPDLQQNEGW